MAEHSDSSLAAAAERGPVAVAVEAGRPVFQFYREGIVTGDECGTNLNHAVTVTGVEGDHYEVRNSWGSGWGNGGYILIGRTGDGHPGVCGINQVNSQPHF